MPIIVATNTAVVVPLTDQENQKATAPMPIAAFTIAEVLGCFSVHIKILCPKKYCNSVPTKNEAKEVQKAASKVVMYDMIDFLVEVEMGV